MGTDVAQAEHTAVFAPTNDDRFAQQGFGNHLAMIKVAARLCQIPAVTQMLGFHRGKFNGLGSVDQHAMPPTEDPLYHSRCGGVVCYP